MSSIWSSGAATQMAQMGGTGHAGGFPFATAGGAPAAGGSAAAQFQSLLKAQGSSAGAARANASSGTNGTDRADGSDGTNGSDSSDTGITANDFLTLLVTEMQNQDPTADTDPNEYIDQLVQINSLEQLISINQNLATVLGAASAEADARTSPTAGPAARGDAVNAAHVAATGAGRAHAAAAHGNLSAPRDAPAAHAVARSLDGHTGGNGHAHGAGHAIRDIPTRVLP